MLIKEVSYLLQREQHPYHTKISGGILTTFLCEVAAIYGNQHVIIKANKRGNRS